MSSVPTDAGLALVTLAVFVGAFVVAGAEPSLPFLILGAIGTLAFELLATRRSAAVRAVWEHRSVQAGSLTLAVLIAIVGAVVAPASVLSAGTGALSTYLLVLAIVVVDRR